MNSINLCKNESLTEREVAQRVRGIIELLSSSLKLDSYWFDKSEDFITEIIKLIKLYNENNVSLLEFHKMASSEEYRKKKIEILQTLLNENTYNENQKLSFRSATKYFDEEFDVMDSKIRQIIITDLTKITQQYI